MPQRNNRRTTPTLEFELALQDSGYAQIAGLDEAGRGAWAGPVVAAAVLLPLERSDLMQVLAGVTDSKQLSAKQRSEYAQQIRGAARSIGVGAASALEVDRMGLLPATRAAMRRSLRGLDFSPQHLLLDYLILPDLPIDQTALPKGDARVLSIAAASIIAKVTRDEFMRRIALIYPEYGFERHKGYGTCFHREVLGRLGPTPIHRFSYQPVGQRSFRTRPQPGV